MSLSPMPPSGVRLGVGLPLCEHFGTEVVIVNASEEASFEDELVQDVLEIITVFSARLYGSRSHKNKTMVEALKAAADEVAGS